MMTATIYDGERWKIEEGDEGNKDSLALKITDKENDKTVDFATWQLARMYNDGTIMDLSGETGDYDGQIGLDDGTNTTHRGCLCVWDDTNSVWVNAEDGSTFS